MARSETSAKSDVQTTESLGKRQMNSLFQAGGTAQEGNRDLY